MIQGCNAQMMNGERVHYPASTEFTRAHLVRDVASGTYDLFFDGRSFCPVRFSDDEIARGLGQQVTPVAPDPPSSQDWVTIEI
jgi:hypothetical protein